MKRKSEMKRLMMLVAVFTVAMQIVAETETVGGYTWTDCISGGVAENVV